MAKKKIGEAYINTDLMYKHSRVYLIKGRIETDAQLTLQSVFFKKLSGLITITCTYVELGNNLCNWLYNNTRVCMGACIVYVYESVYPLTLSVAFYLCVWF